MGKTQQLGMYPNIGISSSGTPTTNYLPKFTGASTIGNSLIYDNGTNVGIGNTNTSYTFDVTGTGNFSSTLRSAGSAYFGMVTGGVGIATTNLTYGSLNIKASGTQLYNGIALYSTDGTESFLGIGNSGSLVGFNVTYGATGSYLPLAFILGGSERMRITSGGNVQIGATTDMGSRLYVIGGGGQGAGWIQQDSAPPLYLNRTGNDGGEVIFLKAGTQVGYIGTNAYSLPSDANFKKNIDNLELGLNLVNKLRPVSYNHKIDDEDAALSTGFIAQELEQSLLDLGIKKNKYYILQHVPNEKDGESQYWLDYQKMIPVLVNAINELSAKVTALENQS